MWQFVTGRLNPLHDIFLFSHDLDMLLPNEFKEFAHLLSCGIVAFVIVATTWAILVMFSIVRAQQMLDNSFQFRRQMALRTDELECVLSFLCNNFFDAACNAVFVLFGTSFLHLAL